MSDDTPPPPPRQMRVNGAIEVTPNKPENLPDELSFITVNQIQLDNRKIAHLAFEYRPSISATKDKPIIRFTKNGEMAPVEWFRWGNLEFNGKYVTEIGYED